jgi:hypothetical protein
MGLGIRFSEESKAIGGIERSGFWVRCRFDGVGFSWLFRQTGSNPRKGEKRRPPGWGGRRADGDDEGRAGYFSAARRAKSLGRVRPRLPGWAPACLAGVLRPRSGLRLVVPIGRPYSMGFPVGRESHRALGRACGPRQGRPPPNVYQRRSLPKAAPSAR